MIALAFTLQQGDFELTIDVRLGAGVTSLFGPSGAGKTTILDAIAGLRRPSTGASPSAIGSCSRRRSASICRRIGATSATCPQDVALFPHMNVRRNMLYGRRPGHRPDLSVVARHPGSGVAAGSRGRRAVGRPAPARRARAGADVEPGGAAARRAARRGRRRAAPPDPAVPGRGCATSCVRRSCTSPTIARRSCRSQTKSWSSTTGGSHGRRRARNGRTARARSRSGRLDRAGRRGSTIASVTLHRCSWDYHQLHHQLAAADAILVLCSHDLRVAERGAELFLEGWAPLLIFSGGLGSITRALMTTPEADQFAAIAAAWACRRTDPDRKPVDQHRRKRAIHAGADRSARHLQLRSFIVVQKPYMERRSYATFKKVWPEPEVRVTSPQVSMDEYLSAYSHGSLSPRDVVSIMVGDLQRIRRVCRAGVSDPAGDPGRGLGGLRGAGEAGVRRAVGGRRGLKPPLVKGEGRRENSRSYGRNPKLSPLCLLPSSLSASVHSLRPERPQWIDAERAPRRQVARQQRDRHQHHRDRGERGEIGRLHAIEE